MADGPTLMAVIPTLKELAEEAGGHLSEMAYWVRVPSEKADGPVHLEIPSLHLVPPTPGGDSFLGALAEYIDEPEELVLVAIDGYGGRKFASVRTSGFRLTEEWRREGNENVVTWTISFADQAADRLGPKQPLAIPRFFSTREQNCRRQRSY